MGKKECKNEQERVAAPNEHTEERQKQQHDTLHVCMGCKLSSTFKQKNERWFCAPCLLEL